MTYYEPVTRGQVSHDSFHMRHLVTFIKTESRSMDARVGRRVNGKLFRYGVPVGRDQKVLEMGIDYASVGMYT